VNDRHGEAHKRTLALGICSRGRCIEDLYSGYSCRGSLYKVLIIEDHILDFPPQTTGLHNGIRRFVLSYPNSGQYICRLGLIICMD
jgi:hypothetical protein